MVLTITMVGNGQNGAPTSGNNLNGGSQTENTVNSNTVLSPNDLAQLMSGQTVTGMLNPDGSITLNSNMLPTQQMTSIATTTQSSLQTSISTTSGANYMPRLQADQMIASPTSSINTLQTMSGDSDISIAVNNNNNQHRVPQTTTVTNQKKTGQKRLTAKQKLAQQLQLQKNQQPIPQQQNDTSHMVTNPPDHSLSQQPQIVATVQLPNGQIGQLIAPSGGHFWSPNAINLQQLSMAVAAATGTMPQPISIPNNSSTSQQGHQMSGSQNSSQQSMQSSDHIHQNPQQQQQNSQQHAQQNQQQQSSQNVNNQNPTQVMTTIQLPNNQIAQVMGRPAQNQLWSSGSISISQLSALAQQGVVQLSPIQGISTGSHGQIIPQTAIQGLLNQNGQPIQAIPISSGSQFIAQDPEDPSKWQIVQPSQVNAQQTNMQQNVGNSNVNDMLNPVSRDGGNFDQFDGLPGQTLQNASETSQSSQPQKKLKRLACTCPNCRDGDNNRSNGDKKKQHICHFPDCNKVYGKTSHLRAHLRWHSGERPYVCNWSFCGKKFTRSDELQRHRRTHTGEKRFQCPECLKRFMRSDHLSKHLKTHLSSKKPLHSD